MSGSSVVGVSIVVLASVASVFAFWQMTSLLDEFLSLKQRRLFQEDLTMSILNSRVTWEDVLHLAEVRGVKQSQIHRALKRMLREVLTGRNLSLAQHRHVIDGFLAKLKETEPFDGLPNELRIHLERLREQLHSHAPLEPLTLQIRELVAINSRDRRLQKIYTVGGFVLGIVGLAFAAFTYLIPPQPKLATTQQTLSSEVSSQLPTQQADKASEGQVHK